MGSGGDGVRVLAITTNHALVIGLTFLDRPWDVSSRATFDDGLDADVLVVDLGATHVAREALDAHPTRPPAVVVGIEPVELPETDRFLPRPFTLDQLADMIEELTELAAADAASDPDRRSPSSPPLMPDDGRRTTGGFRTGHAAPQAGFWVVPGWALGPSASSADEDLAADAGTSGTDELIDLRPFDDESPADAAHVTVPGADPARHGAPASSGGARLRKLRSLATRTRASSPIRPELRRDAALQRFARGVAAAGELESLIDEMPLLRSLRSLSQAIVDEVHRSFAADSTALWDRFDDGFRVLANRGLTTGEAHLVAALDQPMLGEIHTTGGGLLIDPVEAAQAAVAGIGGAHTESFMSASISIGEARYGILAVGRDSPLVPADLDALIDLATEAAPGIAIAQLLGRLSNRIVVPTVDIRDDVFAEVRTKDQARLVQHRT